MKYTLAFGLLWMFATTLSGCGPKTSTPAAGTGPSCGALGATVFATNMPAKAVLGQADFVSGSANRGGTTAANTLNVPIGVWKSGQKILVSDASNSRILVYNSTPATNGPAADVVIGQGSFTTSAGGTTQSTFSALQSVTADSRYVYASEFSNNRITVFDILNLTTGMNASYVLGQPNFTTGTSNTGGASASSLATPVARVAVGTKLFITDAGNNRVLIYDTTTMANQKPAIVAVGQADKVSTTNSSASGRLDFPLGIATDGKKLVIVDSNNSRIYIYNSIPAADGVQPDVVWGSGGATSAITLNYSVGAFYDGIKLFLADRSNHRVLIFNSLPTTSNQPPDVVLGQPDFISGSANQGGAVSARTLQNPHMVYYDGCNLYVADKDNHRVVVY